MQWGSFLIIQTKSKNKSYSLSVKPNSLLLVIRLSFNLNTPFLTFSFQKIVVMVTSVASTAFTTIASLSSEYNPESTNKLGGLQNNVNKRVIKLKVNMHTPSKTNGNNLMKIESHNHVAPLIPSSRTSFNSLLDWELLFGNITKEFTKKTNQKDEEQMIDDFGIGELVQNGLVYRQNFPIRSYEIGADGTVSLETLMNHLQEIVLNHLKRTGLLGDGLGSTPEMYKRNLIWVTTKVQIVIDRYPTWGDAVQIDDWIVPSGKTHMRRDSVIRDCKTGEILVRASSNWVLMNKVSRKLCRIPDEVRDEMGPYMMDAQAAPILENDNKKTQKLDETTADHILNGLKPRWSDLDINQHVNNAKYIGWILESVPSSILENKELSRITLEYRRECHRDDVLQSLTAILNSSVKGSATDSELVECEHLLRLKDGTEVMKARSQWRQK